MGTCVALRKPALRRLLCPVIGGWGMENLSNGPYKEECKPWKVKGLRTETKQGERISGHKRCFPLGVGLGGLGRPFLYPALPGEAPLEPFQVVEPKSRVALLQATRLAMQFRIMAPHFGNKGTLSRFIIPWVGFRSKDP
jgi:hypothetical protein